MTLNWKIKTTPIEWMPLWGWVIRPSVKLTGKNDVEPARDGISDRRACGRHDVEIISQWRKSIEFF
jgi:hypothetical protein